MRINTLNSQSFAQNLVLASLALGLALATAPTSSQARQGQGGEGASTCSQSIGVGAPSSDVTCFPGLRRFGPVVGGVWRAGGPGGQRSLPRPTLQQLCESGVGTTVYLYPRTNFSTGGQVNCQINGRPHTMEYIGHGFNSEPETRSMLEKMRGAATGARGHLLFHCWNGVHATGYLAAVARMQFCNHDAETAVAYLLRVLGKSENQLADYERNVLRKVRSFRPYSDLTVDAATAARVCPRGR